MAAIVCKNQINPHKSMTLLSIVVVLFITTTMLLWGANTREQDFLQSQRNLAENSVIGTANQITQKIADLRQGIKLFAQKEKQLLKQIAENPDDLDKYDNLVDLAKAEFPNAVAITIADKNGDPYVEDFDGFILDICRVDIKRYSGTRHPPNIFIHPNPLAYHFDIMVKVDIGLGEQSIFFMSFSPELITRILNNGELYSHKLTLIKNDSSGLIEITSKGARDMLPADNIRLTDEQRNKIIYTRPVLHTAWKLIDFPVNDYLSKRSRQIWTKTYAMITLLFLFSGAMLFLLGRVEKKAKIRTEAAIRDKVTAEYANKAKSNFLANMSHEIRTPLTAIIGYGETLLRSDQSMKERVHAVNTIIGSGEHLLNLINDILDVSKIEAEKLVLEQVKESPYKLINEVKNIVSGQVERKNVDFSINYDFPLPRYIYSDYVRIKQILLNLCSNAIKFTEKGYIRINMRYEQDMDRLYFIVQDSGIGMSERAREKVFDSFTQADESTTRKYGGSGLGLTLSKQLANLLNGDIDVDSKPGIGSTFAFYIPTNLSVQNNLINSESDIPVLETVSSKPICVEKLMGRVLVAEDNENNQKLIQFNLEKMGLDVVVVDNGKKAIDTALAGNFDLVIMDMQMPVMGGLEAVVELRYNNYQQAIVALTASALQEDKDRCMRAGCNDFVTKPIHYEQLYQVVKQYLAVQETGPVTEPLYSTILENDADFKDLMDAFIDSLIPTKKKLNHAFNEEDWKLFSGVIHQIKGLGGSYGYPDITQVAAKIEFQLVSENISEVSLLLNELFELFDRAIMGHLKTTDMEIKAVGD
ncbi:ATP-binding protein [Kaarinaea lacus]